MLEFLNEQDDLEVQNKKDTSNEKVPSGTGQPEEGGQKGSKPESDDFVSARDNVKSVKRSTVILAILFAAGLAGLFIMIKKGAPRLVSAQTVDPQQVQIDTLVAKLGGVRTEMSNKMDTIVKKFYEFADVKQISLDQLAKNPFMHGKIDLTSPSVENKVLVHTRKTSDFKLFSIMKDDADASKSCCMINDILLSVGQTILGFTVKEIGSGFVVLQSGENKIILRLVED